MDCPHCKSENTVKCSVLCDNNTSDSLSTIQTGFKQATVNTTNRNKIVHRCDKPYASTISFEIFTLGLIFSGILVFGAFKTREPVDYIFYIGFPALFVLYYFFRFRWLIKVMQPEYNKKMILFNKKWFCMRCGEVYIEERDSV